ncbi:MAG: ATP-dependent DNA helicase RecG [Patescibacteria group bacterium]
MDSDFFTISVEELKGIGPYYLKRLTKLGIKTIRDLLWHFPVRYEDYSDLKKISEIKTEGICSALGKIEKISTRKAFRKRLFITEAVLYDKTGTIDIVWFGQPYLKRTIPEGAIVIVSGKVQKKDNKLFFNNPVYEVIYRSAPASVSEEEIDFSQLKHTAGLIPVYPETRGLTSRGIRFLIKPLMEKAKKLPEFLPEPVLKNAGLMDYKKAIKQAHFPDSLELAEQAKKRFVFEEIFLTQLLLLELRQKNALLKAPQIPIDIDFVKQILKTLSFELTESQKKALWRIIRDLARKYPMNRLLNGDVGSGKTIVALISLACAVKAGFQGVFMVPTEILSYQHFQTAGKLLKDFGIDICLLISKEARIVSGELEGELKKSALKKIIQEAKPVLVIGTQALIQKDVDFVNLGLVVVDEQHRFGVRQRQQLLVNNESRIKNNEHNKSIIHNSPFLIPHLLTMTATPIPRTLALGLWGDLDVSFIAELPKGRKKIITKIISQKQREQMYQFIREKVKAGEQVFIICPRIEKPEDQEFSYEKYLRLDTKAVKEEYEKLSKEIFPDLKLDILHGKLKSREKELVMKKFSGKEVDILVSTSVIEVGIDVPNATIMVIEGADYFGLAQLHQFRGRVGRGEKQSYCFLLTESESKAARQRLSAFSKIFDGFKLAEQDLKLRGPGQFFGVRQSGIPDLATKALKDFSLVLLAREQAEAVLQGSPRLEKYPRLKQELENFRQRVHLE